jgi:hypothetical protein
MDEPSGMLYLAIIETGTPSRCRPQGRAKMLLQRKEVQLAAIDKREGSRWGGSAGPL